MSNAFRPRESRQKVVLPAKMRAGAGQVDICIRDISSRGMLIQAGTPPPRGTYVEIVRPGYSVTGRVVWAKDHKFGIQSRGTISFSAMLERRREPRPGGGTAPLNQSQASVGARAPPDPEVLAARARNRAAFLQYAILAGAVALCALLLASGLYRGLADTFAGVIRQMH